MRSAQLRPAPSAPATIRRSSSARSLPRGRGLRPALRRRDGCAPAWSVRRSRVDCRSQSRSMPAVSRSSAPSIAASARPARAGVDPLVEIADSRRPARSAPPALGSGGEPGMLGGGERSRRRATSSTRSNGSTASAASSALRTMRTGTRSRRRRSTAAVSAAGIRSTKIEDRIGAGRGGEPRLALDHRPAGKRQRRAQHAPAPPDS